VTNPLVLGWYVGAIPIMPKELNRYNFDFIRGFVVPRIMYCI